MSQIKNTKWQMAYQVQDVVALPEEDWLQEYGGLPAYNHMSFPPYVARYWQDAPLSDGNLNFVKDSRIPGGHKPQPPWKYVDFTYFRTIVQIPSGAEINSFKVIINKVDDGARIYLFNNKCKSGIDTNQDGKLQGSKVTADFSMYVAEGQNTIVIVQFDNNPTLNTLTGGIDIMINDEKISVDPGLPIPPTDGIERTFHWASGIKVSDGNPKVATGQINGIPFKYTSSVDITIGPNFYNYSKFRNQTVVPNIPDTTNIRNINASINTLTFEREIKDPIIVFATIGNANQPVPIEFHNEIQILWEDKVSLSGRTITGREGYAIIKLPGRHREIKFEYKQDEYYANFFFGYED